MTKKQIQKNPERKTKRSVKASSTAKKTKAARLERSSSRSSSKQDRKDSFQEVDRITRIQEAAYYLAEKRGFQPGQEVDDWLKAERMIDSGPQ